ncbi:MAG: hypothetical protein AB8I08_07045 [Sandaracinaceae bacterium]
MGKPPEREKRDTYRGFGPSRKAPGAMPDPEPAKFEPVDTSDAPEVGVPPQARVPRAQVAAAMAGPSARQVARRGQPAVDIDLIHERRTAPLPDHEWTFVEIWTRNTIYALDSHLKCIAVVDQSTRRAHTDHALIGARLVGGQRRDGEAMELSHPFPRPGSEAVFEQSKGRQVRFSQTSTVTRVVLRLRVLTVATDNILPTWEEITGQHQVARIVNPDE